MRGFVMKPPRPADLIAEVIRDCDNLTHRRAEAIVHGIFDHPKFQGYFQSDEFDAVVAEVEPLIADYYTYCEVTQELEQKLFLPGLYFDGRHVTWGRR